MAFKVQGPVLARRVGELAAPYVETSPSLPTHQLPHTHNRTWPVIRGAERDTGERRSCVGCALSLIA